MPTPARALVNHQEAMQGYAAGPARVALTVSAAGAPVSDGAIREATERALSNGLEIANGSGRPVVSVTIGTMPLTRRNGFVFSVIVQYQRMLWLLPVEGRRRLVLADIHRSSPSVGMGSREFTISDILSNVELRVG